MKDVFVVYTQYAHAFNPRHFHVFNTLEDAFKYIESNEFVWDAEFCHTENMYRKKQQVLHAFDISTICELGLIYDTNGIIGKLWIAKATM